MRIQCDKCGAGYNLPDEKVQGRALRFTCKRCGAVVQVRPEVSEADPSDLAKTVMDPKSAGVVRPAAPASQPETAAKPRLTMEGKPLSEEPSPAGQAAWYLAYSKNKRGPMTVAQIGEHLAKVVVKGEVYVWRAGFDNWKRIQEVAEFAQVVAIMERARSVSAPQPEQPAQAETTEAPTPSPAKPPRPTFTELLKSETGDKLQAAQPAASQKIDLSELMAKNDSGASRVVPTAGQPVDAKRRSVKIEEYVPPTKKKIPIIPIAILLSLLIVVIATPLVLHQKQVIEVPYLDKVPVIGIYFKKEEVDHYAKLREQWEMLVKIDEAKIALKATKEEEERQRLAEEAEKARRERLERQRRALERRQALAARRRGGSNGGGGGGSNGGVTELDFSMDGDGTEMETIGELSTTGINRKEPLSQGEVNKVIRQNMGRIAACVSAQKKYGAISGTMNMRFTVSRRGSVVGANVLSEKFKGTYVADCVGATIERIRFPKSGGSVTVSYPFTIQ